MARVSYICCLSFNSSNSNRLGSLTTKIRLYALIWIIFFFSEIWQSFSVYDTLLVLATLLILIKIPTISNEYKYFVFSLLIFLLISIIGWFGFTLNFLILFILYSTLVVIFWIFSLGFDDFELKKEVSDASFVYYLSFFFFFLKFKLTG